MTKKVTVFTGTRAEYGLLYWLLKDIKQDVDLTLQLLVTGMHLSPEFGLTYKEIEKDGFYIDEKVEILISSDSAVGVAKSIGVGVIGFSDALERLSPDILIILGDRFEALAIAQTAMVMRIPIVHLHGGEITEGAYDDAIRHAITKLSYLHITATEDYRKRVIQLGEAPERVFNFGAIGLEHLMRTNFMSISELSKTLNFQLKPPYAVVTYHPVTLGEEIPAVAFQSLLNALDDFPELKIIITYPNADDGGRCLITLLNEFANERPNRVLAISSLGHARYLSAVKHSSVVVGNSSSGIIEVPSMGVPTVNIGMRQQGRLFANSVFHCAPTREEIRNTIATVLSRNYKTSGEMIYNPYGQGSTSTQIVEKLKALEFSAVKKFYDLKVSE